MKIQTFLDKFSKFKGLYHPGLECQIMVAQDDGTKKGNGFANGLDFWYNLRICKAGVQPKYSLEKYAEAIGCSGWNFVNRVSEWVGYDFDSIVGHKAGLTDAEITSLIQKAKSIPWIEIRKSTSGRGIHFYVFLDVNESIKSRKEHQVLAKAVLRNLSGLLGFDFKAKVDKCGGILWQWHRKGNLPESFELIKQATEKLTHLPPDWRTENQEFKGKVQPLTHNLKFLSLCEEQQKLLNWFANQKTTWWWDSELNMLVCHTFDLARAHKELNLKGVFYTNASGKDCPNDQNCFAFPIKNGAWIIRRHSPGCREHPYWQTDKSGWTYCYYNKIPTVQDLVKLFNGQENAKSEYVFTSGTDVVNIINILSPGNEFSVPTLANNRKYTLKPLKNSRINIRFERSSDDPFFPGWIATRDRFEKVVGIIEEEQEIITPDNIIRHVIADGKDSGWYLNSKNWVAEPKSNISSALTMLGYKGENIEQLIGQCILNPWELVNQPFEPEYPGNRKWNKFSPQLLYEPKEGKWEKWKQILNHIGSYLDSAVQKNTWCRAYEIKTGSDYLFLWVASIFQYPLEPLPYLFLFGPQLSGKSTFHETISLLVNRGVIRADNALTNPLRFNGELAGSILCVVEETNLKESKLAYNRIKDWVTGKTISIHEKGKTPFELQNSCHWIQCSNHPDYCPISFGDTRIIMIEVPLPEIIKPKEQLFFELREQAPAFIFEILNKKVPPSMDRLRIPVLETEEKMAAQEASANLVERFIQEKCFIRKGHIMPLVDFMAMFHSWLTKFGEEPFHWPPQKIGRAISLSANMPVKGRWGGRGDIFLGNLSFDAESKDLEYDFIKSGDRIVKRTL